MSTALASGLRVEMRRSCRFCRRDWLGWLNWALIVMYLLRVGANLLICVEK